MISVYINDSKTNYDNAEEYFAGIDAWAREYCDSYQGYHLQDVSDVSYQWDYVAQYVFGNDKDANWFSLKWL